LGDRLTSAQCLNGTIRVLRRARGIRNTPFCELRRQISLSGIDKNAWRLSSRLTQFQRGTVLSTAASEASKTIYRM